MRTCMLVLIATNVHAVLPCKRPSVAGSVHLSQGLQTWGVVSRDAVCRPVLGLALTGLCMRLAPLQRHVVVVQVGF
jgi:hypothetical protein